jgi:hypothetical protein
VASNLPIPDDLAPDVAGAVELIKRVEVDRWLNLTGGLSQSPPRITDGGHERLEDLQAWLATRAGDERSFVQAAVANFQRVLHDLLVVFDYEAEEVTQRVYRVQKWYHGAFGGSSNPLEIEFYEAHVLLIRNLVAELTRAINLVVGRAREADARVLVGVGSATVDTGSPHAPMQAAKYSESEQTLGEPYPGLLGFPGVIESRDVGALGQKAEGVPRTVGDMEDWVTELLKRQLAKPSGPAVEKDMPFRLPGPREARVAEGGREVKRRHGVRAWLGGEKLTRGDSIAIGITVTVVGTVIAAAVVLVVGLGGGGGSTGMPNGTPSIGVPPAAKAASKPEPGDGRDPKESGCAPPAEDVPDTSVKLAGHGLTFGTLVLRHSRACDTAWGLVRGLDPEEKLRLVLIANRPSDDVTTSYARFSHFNVEGVYGNELLQTHGCVRAIALIEHNGNTLARAQTPCR